MVKGITHKGVDGVVVDIDPKDEKFYYRVKTSSTPPAQYSWIPKDAVVLLDPSCTPPRPNEPTNCCGSECPDCVWICYWKDLEDYNNVINGNI
ncbi:hypothetical protein TrLO_g10534 [Triparma laevis f. longispina]|uniref:Oxidoreductase-like domain-containing protein n=1 Tax=Triparma laevis f. longispina TaxID=1714387 RepID=A0A9W7KZI2_9STRA|nr:hypothetical protein TrLO_g10534 [Triparma laevis f. longispina]